MLPFRLRASALGRWRTCLFRFEQLQAGRWSTGGVRGNASENAAKNAKKPTLPVPDEGKKEKIEAVVPGGPNVLCDCGKLAVLRSNMAGLRYLRCPDSLPWFTLVKMDEAERRKPRCKFFVWIDKPEVETEAQTEAKPPKKTKKVASKETDAAVAAKNTAEKKATASKGSKAAKKTIAVNTTEKERTTPEKRKKKNAASSKKDNFAAEEDVAAVTEKPVKRAARKSKKTDIDTAAQASPKKKKAASSEASEPTPKQTGTSSKKTNAAVAKVSTIGNADKR